MLSSTKSSAARIIRGRGLGSTTFRPLMAYIVMTIESFCMYRVVNAISPQGIVDRMTSESGSPRWGI